MRNARYLDFPLKEYQARLESLRIEMENTRLDALILTTRDNVEFLCGFSTPSWRLGEKRFWLLVPIDSDPVLFVDQVHEVNAQEITPLEEILVWGTGGSTNSELVANTVKERGLTSANIGLELGAASSMRMTPNELSDLRATLPNATFIDCDEAVGRSRMVKSQLEIERIRQAVTITEAGFTAAFRIARPDITERDLITEIAQEWLRLGAETPYNGNNYGYLALQAGRILQMTPSPVDRKIEQGDLIQVDGGASYRGYTADIYRNAFIGSELPPLMMKYADGTRHVVDSILQAIKPGVTSSELCAVGENAITEIDFGKYRRPLSNAVGNEGGIYVGHAIGFSVHEYPTIQPGDTTPWLPGMCGAIEIPFGDDEIGYLQWEDNFLVTESGVEVLSKSPKQVWLTG
ncbi:MAG: aminopeptidase P family protein [SAR202 cluster bacterium]|nr:aminopeptidase P family protein [SAR202 cluster bacterium]|tara:strand:- start:951 stop:2162 length:1212 start_codon:yes stop_codon:yes gene_type:complete